VETLIRNPSVVAVDTRRLLPRLGRVHNSLHDRERSR
jgi:hypothetical protein